MKRKPKPKYEAIRIRPEAMAKLRQIAAERGWKLVEAMDRLLQEAKP